LFIIFVIKPVTTVHFLQILLVLKASNVHHLHLNLFIMIKTFECLLSSRFLDAFHS